MLEHELLREALSELKRGSLIGLPTETVYGLAGDASNESAVAKIFSLKGRPADHPVIVHLANATQLQDWAIAIPDEALILANAFWPGPLTLILKRHSRVSDLITGGQDTVGIRIPNHPLALEVLSQFGGGLAAPSANRFGRISPTTAAHVRSEFGDLLPLILNGGECAIGIESTIIDLSSGPPRLLRPGMVSPSEIETLIGPIALPDILQAEPLSTVRVSGSLKAHYAPRTPMRMGTREDIRLALTDRNVNVGVLVCEAIDEAPYQIVLGQAAAAYAKGLYSAMRTLDAANLACIWVEQPPLAPEWSAIMDRLVRAVAGAGIDDEGT